MQASTFGNLLSIFAKFELWYFKTPNFAQLKTLVCYFTLPYSLQNMNKLIILFLAIPALCFGQAKINFNQGNILQKQFLDTIPFEYVRDKMIVDVLINKKKKRFIFDTGATLIISNELQAEMNNELIDSVIQIDAVGNRKKVNTVSVKEFDLGSITFQKIPAIVNNIVETGFISCLNVDGLIGSNSLRNCIVQIDLQKKQLILTNNIEKLNTTDSFSTPLILDKQSGPHIKVKLGSTVDFDALFDSGSDDFITLSEKTYSKVRKKKLSHLTNEGFGTTTSSIHGLDKVEKKQRVTIASIDFGQYSIQNFYTVISDGYREDAFGIMLAKYGKVTIDYINKKFYFQPLQQIQKYADITMFGFLPDFEKEIYKIGIVWTNSQAEKLGLKKGFRILKINDIDLSQRTPLSDCAFFMAQPFKKSKIDLTYVDDNGETNKITLQQE